MTTTPPPVPASTERAPTGTLVIHVQGNVLVSVITPTVTVDGYPVPVQYGENRVPVFAGPHRVAAQMQSVFTYGRAEQIVEIRKGQDTELWYSLPLIAFLSGRMGPTKQPVPGLVPLLSLGVAVLVLLLAVIGAMVLLVVILVRTGG